MSMTVAVQERRMERTKKRLGMQRHKMQSAEKD